MTARVFKDLEFNRWSAKSEVTDKMLCAAADEIEAGLVDARLGGYLLKKRVAARGRGKRGSHRTVVAHRQGDRLIFLHGFEKKDKANITGAEKKALHKLAEEYMKHEGAALKRLTERGLIMEIQCHGKPDPQ